MYQNMLRDVAEEVLRHLTQHNTLACLVADEYIDYEDDALFTRYAQRRVRRDAAVAGLFHLEETARLIMHPTDESVVTHDFVPVATFRCPHVAVRCLVRGLPEGCDPTLTLQVGEVVIADFESAEEAVETLQNLVFS